MTLRFQFIARPLPFRINLTNHFMWMHFYPKLCWNYAKIISTIKQYEKYAVWSHQSFCLGYMQNENKTKKTVRTNEHWAGGKYTQRHFNTIFVHFHFTWLSFGRTWKISLYRLKLLNVEQRKSAFSMAFHRMKEIFWWHTEEKERAQISNPYTNRQPSIWMYIQVSIKYTHEIRWM